MAEGSGQPLAATAYDQFGLALANQPAFNSATDTITSPLALTTTVTLLPVAGSVLTIAGGINGAGGLTVDDSGSVVLSGPGSYTGGTNVALGTLVAANPSTIADGTNLLVGTAAADLFNSSVVAASSAAVVVKGVAVADGKDSLYWLRRPAIGPGEPSQQRKKNASLPAIDAVFAQFGKG